MNESINQSIKRVSYRADLPSAKKKLNFAKNLVYTICIIEICDDVICRRKI